MQETVSVAQVATADRAPMAELPARVRETLSELVGAAKEGLLALSAGPTPTEEAVTLVTA